MYDVGISKVIPFHYYMYGKDKNTMQISEFVEYVHTLFGAEFYDLYTSWNVITKDIDIFYGNKTDAYIFNWRFTSTVSYNGQIIYVNCIVNIK